MTKIKIIYPPQDTKYPESFQFYRGLYENRTEDSEEADFLFYIIDLRVYMNNGEGPHLYPLIEAMKDESKHSKIVIIDYSDPPEIRYIPKDIYMKVGWYFKRSMVDREKERMIEYDRKVIPIHYGVRASYMSYDNTLSPLGKAERFDVCCMFGKDLPPDGNRAKARDLVSSLELNVFVGTVYDEGFDYRYERMNRKYYQTMKHSKIIVTANPNGWEGDFRLSEALYTGNLVMCDKMVNPPLGLEHLNNIIFYSTMLELEWLITFYLSDGMRETREMIGRAGREWARKNCFINVVGGVMSIISKYTLKKEKEMEVRSSYKNTLTYGDLLEALIFSHKPKRIVEFGILDGYSLKYFAESGAEVQAYDIFDEFIGNGPPPDIREKFDKYENVTIDYGDFYEKWRDASLGKCDIIHIDIANNGHVYQTAVERYLPLLNPGGFLILEGGSEKRDKVEWMEEYQKPLIRPYLESLDKKRWKVIGDFPSLTIIRLS